MVGKEVYEDTVDCFHKVVRYEGVQGLYRGISLQLAYVATGASWGPSWPRESHQAGHQRLHQGQAGHLWPWPCLHPR